MPNVAIAEWFGQPPSPEQPSVVLRLLVVLCASRTLRRAKGRARTYFERDISRFRLPPVVGPFGREWLNPAAYPRLVLQVFLAELALQIAFLALDRGALHP